MGVLLKLVVLSLVVPSVRSDFFSSIATLSKLHAMDDQIEKSIHDYVKQERERLAKVERYAENWKNSNEKIETIENPVEAFKLLKRSVLDTSTKLFPLLNVNPVSIFSNLGGFPVESDLEGAVDAIIRLQDTYLISASDFANGKLLSHNTSKIFTSDDCAHIGLTSAQRHDHYHAIPWFLEALSQIESEDRKGGSEMEQRIYNTSFISGWVAFSLYEQGNKEYAAYIIRNLAKNDPHYEAVRHLPAYEAKLWESGSLWDGMFESLPPLKNPPPEVPESNANQRRLCRGDWEYTPEMKKLLFCFYKNDKPYLKLAPIKTEVVYRNPDAYLFKEVISDEEIQVVRSLAQPLLKVAEVFVDESTAAQGASKSRTTKTAWFQDSDHEVVKRISKRSKLFSNLNHLHSELLQVANYGLGGHYDRHFDMESTGQKLFHTGGNRIATALFYMSQPLEGGATAFIGLNISMAPSKNDALFWYNLKRNGEPDMNTEHAGCPVLLGQKWVSNKWFHEWGQETTRPCGLHPDDNRDTIAPDYIDPV